MYHCMHGCSKAFKSEGSHMGLTGLIRMAKTNSYGEIIKSGGHGPCGPPVLTPICVSD